jgi:hypothetical protein
VCRPVYTAARTPPLVDFCARAVTGRVRARQIASRTHTDIGRTRQMNRGVPVYRRKLPRG